MQEIIRKADRSDHGGTVLEGFPQTSDQRERLDVEAIPDPDDLLHLHASYWDGADAYSLDFLRNPTKEAG